MAAAAVAPAPIAYIKVVAVKKPRSLIWEPVHWFDYKSGVPAAAVAPAPSAVGMNEYNITPRLTRNNWRASLVPAAAVILKLLQLKSLSVGLGSRSIGLPLQLE